MEPPTVTLAPSNSMSRQQGLLRRSTRWYSNFKVPLDLQAALGKTMIREALGTSDYREACRKVVFERARITALFDNERRKLVPLKAQPAKTEKQLLTVISEREAYHMAARYLATFEHKFGKWMQEEGRFLEPFEREEMRSNVQDDEYDLARGEEFRGVPLDGTHELQQFLKGENIECAVTSPAFQTLRPLFFRALMEYLGRSQDMLKGDTVKERDHLFKGVHFHSPAMVEEQKRATIDDLLALRQKTILAENLSQKTADASQLTARLLREFFGGARQLATIQLEDFHQLFDLLKRIPPNATKRYKGMTLAQAVAAADKAEDRRRLHPKTLRNNYIQISALFNLAVDFKMISENPAKNRRLGRSFDDNAVSPPRQQFTVEELNRLFRSPLHMACAKQEERGGRFWVPLLALFHGLRCNETCQIYTEDVKTSDGITYLAIRREREDGSKSEKRIKTKQSRREVPLHPELKRLGFMEFVQERKRDASSPRLFPDLTAGHKGYFSDAFSKWFTRFVKLTLGGTCGATMHSLRHQFRDATRAARLPSETVARLAGWEDGEGPASRQMNHYGRGPGYLRTLAEDLAKVEYPGLDLSHLHTAAGA
jgi:integrase